MEPSWTKQIPSSFVCDWFYFFFSVGAVISAALVFFIFYLLTATGSWTKDVGFKLFLLIAQLGISLTTTLFFHIMCARSLGPVA